MTAKSTPSKQTRRDFDLDTAKLRRLRMSAGISVTEFAQLTGRSKGHISAVENGKGGISVVTARTFAEVLGVTTSDLLVKVAA